jgi:leader peptidase (prepilin peptidase) / N-methyltransferase
MWTTIAHPAVSAICTPLFATWAIRLTSDQQRRATDATRVRIASLTVVPTLALISFSSPLSQTSAAPALCWFVMTGVVLSIIDFDQHRLPHAVVAAMAGGGVVLLGVASWLTKDPIGLVRALTVAVVVFGAFLALMLLFPGQLGFGDVTLYGAVSLYLGWLGWHAVYTALVATAALAGVAAAVLLVSRQLRRRDRFAHGPFIVAGALVALMSP